jgi:hypothetical protein
MLVADDDDDDDDDDTTTLVVGIGVESLLRRGGVESDWARAHR